MGWNGALLFDVKQQLLVVKTVGHGRADTGKGHEVMYNLGSLQEGQTILFSSYFILS